jgi:phosphoenolpyruvate carboxykinase (ATP)
MVAQSQPALIRDYGLENHGIENVHAVHWNLPAARLYEEIIRRNEARLAEGGALVVGTGEYTGRSPKDKFIVREPSSEQQIGWSDVNVAMPEERFARLRQRVLAYLQGRELFVQDCYVGADGTYRVPVRVITETAWHSLFARDLFRQPSPEEAAGYRPEFTVIHAPNFQASPKLDGTRSEVFVVIHFGQRLILVGGSHYAGEIKKAVFTVMNYLLPQRKVLSMHCAANAGERGDVAIFFGLSGTGKTTLSTDTARVLIGDDEHGWSDRGVFNIEGGCYAKVIRLSPKAEPEIYETTQRFGTVLENVSLDGATGRIDLDDDSITENTRAAYPLSHIPRASQTGTGGHPSVILMLTADAFGVLPPLSRLTPEQAMYHFLSGYTAKVAGTERGVTEPKATFSTCFGAPFMPLPPAVYAHLLGEKIARHKVDVWLVNTGWTGGAYGAGKRIPIVATRAIVRHVMNGDLRGVPLREDPIFGLAVPTACPSVPPQLLDPRATWSDKGAYDAQARSVAALFAQNFERYVADVSPEVRAAAPRLR